MVPMLFDVGAAELLVLVVLVVLLLGPDKAPDLARKAARLLKFLRGVANTATDQIKAELGPELADVDLSDLRPSALAAEVVPSDMRAEMVALKADLAGMQAEVERLRRDAASGLDAGLSKSISPPEATSPAPA